MWNPSAAAKTSSSNDFIYIFFFITRCLKRKEKKKQKPNKHKKDENCACDSRKVRGILDSSHAKRPACVQIKGHSWQQFGPVPWLHYQQLRWSLIGIPAERRRRTSSRPAKGAHLSERHRDHRPTNLPCLPDCGAFRLRIKDKRAEPESGAAVLCRDGPLFKPPEHALWRRLLAWVREITSK